MPVAAESSGFLAGLFPEARPQLLALYGSAAENAGLLRTDFYTIRDLLDLSGYGDEEPLHILLLSLVLALDDGSLCVDASEAGIARRLAYLVNDPDRTALARQAAAALKENGYSRLIGTGIADGKPVVRRCHGTRVLLYFQKYLKHELILQDHLSRRLQVQQAAAIDSRLRTAFEEVLSRPAFLQHNRDQRLALAVALLRNFAIVSGGPGTGKTAIVFTLLRCLVRLGYSIERIALAAPTGRAAQRLTDAVRAGLDQLGPAAAGPDAVLKEISAGTLHRLLGYQPSRGTFTHHLENHLPADVVIVDEVSMVGLVLMSQLLQATDPAAKLILLGDKDQLPSVEAGAVLANLVPAEGKASFSAEFCSQLASVWPPGAEAPGSPADAPGSPADHRPIQDVLVVLEENFRSERAIQEVAAGVNRQVQDMAEHLPRLQPAEGLFARLEDRSGCWLLDQSEIGLGHWRAVLEEWLQYHYLTQQVEGDTYRGLVTEPVMGAGGVIDEPQRARLDRLFAILCGSRILTLVREGAWGSVGINQYLEQLLRPRVDRRGRAGLFAGAPVLVTRNDHVQGLFNGDVGIVLSGPAGGYQAVFPRQGGYLAFSVDSLPSHELAFALTVHKSQGSEYGRVMLVLPPEGGRRLLTKEMIYTGITRARRLAVICAKPEVLRFAIGRRVERESALFLASERPNS